LSSGKIAAAFPMRTRRDRWFRRIFRRVADPRNINKHKGEQKWQQKEKIFKQSKPLPAPNSDFYELYETLNPEELATLKQVRAFADTKVAPNGNASSTQYLLTTDSSLQVLTAFPSSA
jgi:hypothetical protein